MEYDFNRFYEEMSINVDFVNRTYNANKAELSYRDVIREIDELMELADCDPMPVYFGAASSWTKIAALAIANACRVTAASKDRLRPGVSVGGEVLTMLVSDMSKPVYNPVMES